jgi:exodeoxyribonuclease VII large subunit
VSEPEKAAGHNAPEYTVTEISSALKRTVESSFAYVRVKGELSGAKLHSSGHLYMSLKDDKSVLNAVCWKGVAAKLRFKPEDGMEVICTGRITTYPGKSQYQLVVDWMEPAGIGALMAALEQLKKKLLAEGLFEPYRKKAIPFMPQTIGVVTSPTGAVIRDILHRIRDRFPCRVIVWPVAVQGDGAKEQIAAAINGFNAMTENRPDVLIVARGGGSIEDLWAFNEEIVVRAAANSKIPLISAVGHETDTTLIDFVSDLRAPTPTAAAEKAVPVRREVEAYLNELSTRKTSALFRLVDVYAEKISAISRALPRPQELLANAAQRVDDWGERLAMSLQNGVQKQAKKVEVLAAGLSPAHILRQMEFAGKNLEAASSRLSAGVVRRLSDMEKELKGIAAILATLDQTSVLKRGFCYCALW